MKESSGELSMVVVTLIAIAIIAALVRGLRKPITDYINTKWGQISGDTSVKVGE